VWRSVRREQLDREYGTYNALDDKYHDFLNLCLQRPRLDIFDIQDAKPLPLSDEEKKEELIIFTILISIFERAYLMYFRQSSKLRRRQWSGWEDYIRDYAKRKNFQEAFRISGITFDTDFQVFMNAIMKSAKSESPHQ
jgi:hypothetical protein